MTEMKNWACNICDERQSSIDRPRSMVCDACIQTVAERICQATLGVALSTPGLDHEYWMGRGAALAVGLLERAAMGAQRRDERTSP